jgi:endonuclease YncB( thermonuclease family)
MRPHTRLALLGVIFTTTFTFASVAASVGLIEGVATAKDGDDVIVQGIDMRLQGIAAPEDFGRKRQPGGPEATANLKKLVEGKAIACTPDGTKARGRPVVTCTVGGVDVGQLQVEQGFARDCPRYSKGRYADAELRARAAGRNLSSIYPLPSYCR